MANSIKNAKQAFHRSVQSERINQNIAYDCQVGEHAKDFWHGL